VAPENANLNNALIDLSYLGLLSLSGNGAKQLLQGQVTCNMEEVTESQSRLGAQCNPQGRIISLFRAFYFNNQYLLQMPRELLPIAMAAIKKYAVFYKEVLIQDQTNNLKQISYYGSALHDSLPTHLDEAIVHNNILITKTTEDADRYLLLGPQDSIDALLNPLKPESLSIEIWKQQELARGIADIYPETSGQFLPHEINLPKLNGVSFKKGCYTGQEIIARMEYRGKLKKKLVHLTGQTTLPPLRGQEIFSGKISVGNLVDFCQVSYNNTYELLAILPESELQNTLSLDPEQSSILTLISAA
jgi:folate-binding protein YgfZ